MALAVVLVDGREAREFVEVDGHGLGEALGHVGAGPAQAALDAAEPVGPDPGSARDVLLGQASGIADLAQRGLGVIGGAGFRRRG